MQVAALAVEGAADVALARHQRAHFAHARRSGSIHSRSSLQLVGPGTQFVLLSRLDRHVHLPGHVVAVDRSAARCSSRISCEALDGDVPDAARIRSAYQLRELSCPAATPKMAWAPLRPEAPQPMLCSSSSTTSKPRCARCSAVETPAMPPPTTPTSQSTASSSARMLRLSVGQSPRSTTTHVRREPSHAVRDSARSRAA